MGAVFVTSGTAPPEVTSGIDFNFNLAFYLAVGDLFWAGWDFKDATFALILNGIVVDTWSSGLNGLKPTEFGKIEGSHTFGVPQIETALDRVPDHDETVAILCTLQATCRFSTWGRPDKYETYISSPPLTWTVPISVPHVLIYPDDCTFPATVKRDEPFDVSVSAKFQPTVKDTSYIKDYIEAEYGGIRFPLWVREQSDDVTRPPAPAWLALPVTEEEVITIEGIDIESIVGPVTVSQSYDIDIICGTLAAGTIYGTGTGWQRVDEVRATWHVYVAVAPPAPDFLDVVYPPPFVTTDQIFKVILPIENYGSHGDIYIDIDGREVWRSWLEYLETDGWRSGNITIEELVGYAITESGEIEVIFECGYIDEAGNKVATRSLPRIIYVEVVVPPPKANLSGVVSDEGGIPIEGAEIVVNGYVTTTDSMGSYSFFDLAVEYYDITCKKEGYKTYATHLYLAEGDNTLDIMLGTALPIARIAVVAGIGIAILVVAYVLKGVIPS